MFSNQVLLTLSFRLLIVSWITAKRQIVHDRTAQRTSWNNIYDFIVIGAGTAGCVVANRLAENGNVTVLLLEAGGSQDAIYNDIIPKFVDIPAERNQLIWQYYNEPQENAGKSVTLGRINEPKGKVIGGSSSVSDLIYVRGNRRGFDEWEGKYGAIGWNYQGVLPFFKKFENNTDKEIVAISPGYHGTNGPVQISSVKNPALALLKMRDVFNKMGFPNIDMNGPEQGGTMISQLFAGSNSLHSTSGSAYVDPNPYPDNLHIVANALVYKILFNNLTAIGVEFIKDDISNTVLANKEIILSAGAINSPQLLMLSGIGPRRNLEKYGIRVILDLPVGNGYKNHPSVRFSEYPSTLITLNNLQELYFNKSGALSDLNILMTYMSTKNNPDKNWPNVKICMVASPTNTNAITYIFIELQRVLSEGTIRLQSPSPYIQPVITTNFLSDPRDFEDMVDATKFTFYLLQMPDVSNVLPNITLESVGCNSCPGVKDYLCQTGIECYVRNYTNSVYHSGGSCRMGAINRPDVVVGPDLRVKRTQQLRVCDASIFPDLPNANTDAASFMTGEKCAHLIKTHYTFCRT